MKKLSAVALLLASLASPMAPAPAKETTGQQSEIVASLPTGGFNCGRPSYPMYCYGFPVNIGGTFWLDVYTNAYPTPNGLIFFNVADLGEATVTGASVTRNTLGQVASLSVTFNGTTKGGDNGTDTGTGTFNFNYYEMSDDSGRGGGFPSYIQVLTSGSVAIHYN
jgi:hypothetical protein